MLINELAKASGLTKDTVRYYTKMGLLEAREKVAGSRVYADYDERAVEILKEIRLAKSAGFTLSEIRDAMIEYEKGTLTPQRMIELFQQKLIEIRQKQRDLQDVEKMLLQKIKKFNAKQL